MERLVDAGLSPSADGSDADLVVAAEALTGGGRS